MKLVKLIPVTTCLVLFLCLPAAGAPPLDAPEPTAEELMSYTPVQLKMAQKVEWVLVNEDPDLRTASGTLKLKGVDQEGLIFKRLENTILRVKSYFHQRRIGDAIVEKDFIRYMFNTETGEMIRQTRRWREDLPETLEIKIPHEVAEAKAPGTFQSIRLMIISPESEIFHFDPVPANPCWVIRTRDEFDRQVITVVDAVTGEILGNGVPAPSEGQAIGGPDRGACPTGEYYYSPYATNANGHFNDMGYTSVAIDRATETQVRAHVQSDDGVMFYELDHGGPTSFLNRCEQDITATEIESWISSYSSMGFAFIGSCTGLCSTVEDTFATEFSKGQNTDSVLVGYCDMDAWQCDDCWGSAIAWQNELFDRMESGETVLWAYFYANQAVPNCADDSHNCMRTFGDILLRFNHADYPEVRRSRTGTIQDTYFGWPFNTYISPLLPVKSYSYTRAHHLRGYLTIPSGQNLTVTATSSSPYNEIAFNNNARLTATGNLNADVGTGIWVKFVSAADKTKGLEISGDGELEIMNGGQIRIYE